VRIRTLLGLAVVAAMALVLVTPVSVSAQTPPPAQPQTQAPPPQAQPPATREPAPAAQQLRSPVEADLVSVDPDAKKITVKPMSGANLVFSYTDTTEISGAQKDAAGLATLKEGKVTVHFTEDAATKAKTATRIIVAAKK
jgi:hypothetical protein